MVARWVLLSLTVGLGCRNDGPAATSDSTSGGDSGATAPTTVPADDSTSEGGLADSSSGPGDSGDTGTDPCASTPPPGRPVDWTRYGLDDDNSRHNAFESVITTANVHCLQPLWQRNDLAGVTSTPSVVGDVVYFGEWNGTVHALSVSDGSEIWTREVGAQVNDSPLVTDDAVYVGDWDGSVHSLSRRTGAINWSMELDAHPSAAIYSSPIIADRVLVVGVASVELATSLPDYTFRGSVVGLDPATGAELWRIYTADNDASSGAGVSVWSTAAVDDARGWVFIGSGNAYEEPAGPLSDSLLAIEASSGALQWSTQFTTDDVFTVLGPAAGGPDSDVGAAPNLFTTRSGHDLVGVGDKAGYYRAVDRDTGAVVWINEVGPGAPLGGIMTTAAYADGVVYVTNNTWNVLYEFGNDENSGVTAAISIEGGAKLWEVPIHAPIFGAVTLAGGVLYHGTVTGDVLALDASDGTELWRHEPGFDIGGGVSVVNGRVFVGHGFWFFLEPANPNGGFVVYGFP